MVIDGVFLAEEVVEPLPEGASESDQIQQRLALELAAILGRGGTVDIPPAIAGE